MPPVVVWNGPEPELYRLSVACEHNCDCVNTAENQPAAKCNVHRMLADQRIMDHLAYVAYTREHWQRGEWSR